MIHQVVTRVSLDSFRERSAGKKIVLLYPWTNYRNLFLSHFLASANEGLLYYRIPNEITELRPWLRDMVQELEQVVPSFGGHLGGALDSEAAPDALGAALARDLGAYRDGYVILFVDELDRIEFDDTFVTFVNSMVENMGEDKQVAFSSRLLTHQPWYDMVASGQAVVLGTEYRKNDVMFTVEEDIKPQLEVYAFGRGHAIVNGHEITNWDGALPRNLFFYFIDNPLVTRDDIFTTFWPNLSVKEATNVFHVTKRKISERITMKVTHDGNFELTQYTSGFYMPGDKIVRHYDVDDFQEAIERAAIIDNELEEEKLYRRAIDLYKAPFLETMDIPWVQERREHLKQLYAKALIGIGRICRQRGDDEEALGYFTRALKETPEREDIHREVMKLYIEMGLEKDARKQYKHMEKRLKQTVGLKPSEESKALYESLK